MLGSEPHCAIYFIIFFDNNTQTFGIGLSDLFKSVKVADTLF